MSQKEETDKIMNQIIDRMQHQIIPAFEEMHQQSIAYGQVVSYVGTRKWWNPLRWIKGKFVHKIVGPKEFYLGPKRWWQFWK